MSEPEGASILLIEDEPQIRRFLRASLGAQGYRLVEAVTGEDGLLQAATRQPDLVLLDLGLPTSTAWTSSDGCANGQHPDHRPLGRGRSGTRSPRSTPAPTIT